MANKLRDAFLAAGFIRFEGAIYVPHSFIKKTPRSAKSDIDIAKARYNAIVK